MTAAGASQDNREHLVRTLGHLHRFRVLLLAPAGLACKDRRCQEHLEHLPLECQGLDFLQDHLAHQVHRAHTQVCRTPVLPRSLFLSYNVILAW